MTDTAKEKRLAAESAAQLVESGMTVGLGTGSTLAYLRSVLARRTLDISWVAISPPAFDTARSLGLDARPLTGIDRLDLAIDGAEQMGPGDGHAYTREEMVAATAARYGVIVWSNKLAQAAVASARHAPPCTVEPMLGAAGSGEKQ
jgi:ribose 5-phosphate isomerase A